MSTVSQERVNELHVAIQQIYPEWRYRWCGPEVDEPAQDWHACACMGAANCSGGLGRAGFTRAEWEEWVAQNPPQIEGVEKFIDANGRYDKKAHDDEIWGASQKRLELALRAYTN